MNAAQGIKIPRALRVRQTIRVDDFGCWIWTGNLHRTGYGIAPTGPAHRFSYQEFIGPIPRGLALDHLCRVHPCVNPSHCEPVTPVENVYRGKLGVLGRGFDPAAAFRREAAAFARLGNTAAWLGAMERSIWDGAPALIEEVYAA